MLSIFPGVVSSEFLYMNYHFFSQPPLARLEANSSCTKSIFLLMQYDPEIALCENLTARGQHLENNKMGTWTFAYNVCYLFADILVHGSN